MCIHLLHTREWNDFNCAKSNDRRFPLYALCEIRCTLKGNVMTDMAADAARISDDVVKNSDVPVKVVEDLVVNKGNETASVETLKGGEVEATKYNEIVKTESAVKNNDIPSTWRILSEKTKHWLSLPSTLQAIKKYAGVSGNKRNVVH